MRKKNVVILGICLAFTVSVVSPVYAYANPAPPPPNAIAAPNQTPPALKEYPPKKGEFSKSSITLDIRKKLDPDGNKIPDKYNFDQKGIRELMKAGFSIKEIYQADALGNSLDIDPRILLERMKSEEKALYILEEEIRADMFYEKLIAKYPEEYQELLEQKFSEDDIMTILAFIDLNVVTLMSDFIEEFKKDANGALEKYKNPKKIVPPHEVGAETSLGENEVLWSRDLMFESSILIARGKNFPIKDYLGRMLREVEGVLLKPDEP